MAQFTDIRHLAARTAALLVIAVVLCSSCGSARPTVEDWQPAWDRITAAIPSEATIGGDGSVELCDETLVFLRANRAALLPTPDRAIDDTVNNWVQLAEDAFFECPPHSSPTDGFSEAYQELLRLQSEVELVLDMDRSS